MAAAAINGVKTATSPNQTLYVSNLNDKLQKEDLRRSLYCLFSTYGPVLDVIAMKTNKMRGSAHVVFRDVNTSSQAMRALQGFDFFGKDMVIAYAKGKSSVISKLDGSAKAVDSRISTAAQVTMNETQKSVFNNPNAGLPPKPVAANPAASLKTLVPPAADGSKSPQGVKRPREDESDDEDAPMEEDSGDEAMEESDED